MAFFLLGIGVFGYTMIHGLFHITDSLTQVVVPGSADLALKKELSYTVFLEEEFVANGWIYSATESVRGLTCTVKAKGSSETIKVSQAQGSVTYNVNGRSGRSVLAASEDGNIDFA